MKATVSRMMLSLLFMSFLLPSLSTNSVKGVPSSVIRITDYVTGLNFTTVGNATQQLPPGGIPFILNVTLSGATSDLMGWQVAVTFDNNSLKCNDILIPESDPSYVFHGLTEFTVIDVSESSQNATYTQYPQVVAAATLMDPTKAVTVSNALLCMMNFTAFRVGEKSETMISFYPSSPNSPDTFLTDSYGAEIPSVKQGFSLKILEGTVVPDYYPTIQAAINHANSGDSILVRKGTYHENVVVNKTVALVGEDRATTIIDGDGTGYVVGIRGVNNVTVRDFTIQNGQTGVYVGDWGAGIASSRGNILHNVVRNNSQNGIYVDQTAYQFLDNQVENSSVGINLYGRGGVHAVFRNNVMGNNSKFNLALNLTIYDQLDMDATNSVDGKPVYYWVRHLDETVPSDAGQVTLVNCSNVVVQDLELSKNSVNLQFIKVVNCTAKNLKSSFADIGILLVNSTNCKIDKNTLTDCRVELQVLGSTRNNVTSNYFLINGFCGADLGDSVNNSVYHNTMDNVGGTHIIYRAGHNIWDDGYPSGGNYWSDYAGTDVYSGPNQDQNGSDGIGDTPYVVDANNTDHYPLMTKKSLEPVHNLDTGLDYPAIQVAINAPETLNGHRIRVEAGTYYEHLIVNKSLSLFGDNILTVIIDGSSNGTVMNITVSGVNVTGFTIRNSGSGYQSCGILLSSGGNTISHNIIENNDGGIICLFSSSGGNTINGNDVLNSTGAGISLFSGNNSLDGNDVVGNLYYGVSLSSSDNNVVMGNNISGNGHCGVSLHSSSNNSLIGNEITDNDDGVFMWSSSSNNVLSGNRIFGNHYHGVLLDDSSNNTLVGNSVTDNPDYGLGLDKSSDNRIYHNSLVNGVNVVSTQGLINVWDSGYPSGGNYWSNYNGSDLWRGIYQNETGSDGVVDSAYVMDGNNTDHFPLTKPYGGSHDIGVLTLSTSEHAVGHLHLWITAEFINYGEQTETFNVTVRANSTEIQTVTVTLMSRNSTTVVFVWNTSSVAKGNYSIVVTADAVQGETDTTDNSLTSKDSVFVTAPGDVTGAAGYPDGVVNMLDVTALILKFNTRKGGSLWNPDLDVNDDGIVNMRDIFIAILNFTNL